MRERIITRVWIFTLTLFVAVTICAQDLGGVNDLWRHMADHGLITQEQYEYVQEFDRLPSGAVVTNSPVPADQQESWNALATEKVISVEELANVLFEGSILK